MPYDSLNKLAAVGNTSRLEGDWMAALEAPNIDFAALVPVLETLNKKGQAEAAEVLAWSALDKAKQRHDAAHVLPIASRMLVPLDKCDELRKEIAELYKQVYAEAPHIDEIIERSGLTDGSKRPRRALRTLDVCIHATPGRYVLSRHDETVAKVQSADPAGDFYEVVSADGRKRSFSADEFAAEYGPAADDDFRVLEQFRHDELLSLLEEKPADIAVTLIRSHGGQMTQDELRFTISPKHLTPDQWNRWWTRARTALKKNRHVRIEGRSPVVLVYDEHGSDLEAETWSQLKAAHRPPQILAACDGYFRECRDVHHDPQPDFVSKMIDNVIARIDDLRKDHASDAWAAALIADTLVEQHPEAGRSDTSHGVEFLKSEPDPAGLLLALGEAKLRPAAVKAAREVMGDQAAGAFAKVLRFAPEGLCSALARTMIEAGRGAEITQIAKDACANPVESVEMLAWLWKHPKEAASGAAGFTPPPALELLLRMFDALGHVNRDGQVSADERNRVRNAVKGALSAERYKRFDACLAELGESMASTIRTQLTRADGLGNVAPDALLELIRKRFPALWAKPKVDPWADANVIYVTETGLRKHEAAIAHIENVELVDVGRAIGEAAAHGDLSENSEYRFALERRDMLFSRLNVMKDQLTKARVIDPHTVATDHVSIGTRVRLVREDGGGHTEITLLGPWEAEPDNGVYNHLATVCRDVLGKRVGDSAHLNLDGEERTYRVDGISLGAGI
jgi:transcription elongation factor GreA